MDRRNKQIWTALLVLVVLGAVFSVAYRQSSLGGPHSNIVLEGIGSESKVFVDNERANSRERSNQSIISVTPGLREILVSRDGYWPWLKQIKVKENETVTLTPFLFLRDVIKEEVKADDPEYDKLISMTTGTKIPVAPNTLISSDGNVTVWKAHGALYALWRASSTPATFFCTPSCQSEIIFLGIADSVRQIAFWARRPDVVLVTMGKEIYALELDRRNVQNFQPIYRGIKPEFRVMENGDLYVADKELLYLIKTD